MFLGEERRAARPVGRQRNHRFFWRHIVERLLCCVEGGNDKEVCPNEKRARELLIDKK
ncbi:Hypothetical predicted protein, partial [Pelobates cultripes]